MHVPPMMRNVDTTAEPDPIETAHIVQKVDEPYGTGRAADQPIVEADGQQLGMFGTLLIEQIKGIAPITKHIIGMGKAVALVAPIVIRLVGIGNDEMRPRGDLHPVG
jgi:hypothetical protein